MQETVMVGRASGVALPSDFARDRLEFADTTPRGFKASLLHDLERGSSHQAGLARRQGGGAWPSP
jgi:2-dehydropantoate 2-reductase